MGRPIGSTNANTKHTGRKENGIYTYKVRCEVCNVETSNMTMHSKGKAHKQLQIMRDETLSMDEKYVRIGMLNLKNN